MARRKWAAIRDEVYQDPRRQARLDVKRRALQAALGGRLEGAAVFPGQVVQPLKYEPSTPDTDSEIATASKDQ